MPATKAIDDDEDEAGSNKERTSRASAGTFVLSMPDPVSNGSKLHAVGFLATTDTDQRESFAVGNLDKSGISTTPCDMDHAALTLLFRVPCLPFITLSDCSPTSCRSSWAVVPLVALLPLPLAHPSVALLPLTHGCLEPQVRQMKGLQASQARYDSAILAVPMEGSRIQVMERNLRLHETL
jgi:hypothetical protein